MTADRDRIETTDERAAERAQVSRRGQRLDESKPGSGLGLSIVVDLAGLYGGSLVLGDAPIGRPLYGAAVRRIQALSMPELLARRGAAVAAARQHADLEIPIGAVDAGDLADADGMVDDVTHIRLSLVRAGRSGAQCGIEHAGPHPLA